jgi:Xaa-Pro aminopeptidase
MSVTTAPTFDPKSSGEIRVIDFDRADDISRKHELLSNYLKLKGFDALVLQQPHHFSWLTGGGDNTRRGSTAPAASILVTPEARVILCSNADSGQLFDRELSQMGFLLKERPWHEPASVLVEDVCRGRRIASDLCLPGTEDVSADLQDFRLDLSSYEQNLLRKVAREITHAVEATARNFEPGETESDIAGHLAHRLIRHQIQPVQLQVMADGQSRRYRHWSYGTDRVERHCIISAIGRKHGLHVGVSRTVCIGAPSEELESTHQLAMFAQAAGLLFSQPDWSLEETWKRVARIYEKFGNPDEWRVADQAEVLGYRYPEIPIRPHSTEKLRTGMPVYWHPSVRAAAVGDTLLVTSRGLEVLTPSENWPALTVSIKGVSINRPAILIREPASA